MSEQAMASPPVMGTPDGTPATPPVSTFELSKYIDNDGTFKDGYVNELVPEDLRGELVYKKFSDVKGLLKQTGELNRLIGKKGVVIPDRKTATPYDIDALHRE